MCGPRGLGHGQLFRTACASDNFGAHPRTDLDRSETNTASRSQDQQPLARLQSCAMVQRQMGCAIRDQKPGCVFKRHLIRDLDAARRRKTTKLG